MAGDGGQLILAVQEPLKALYNEGTAKDLQFLAEMLSLQPVNKTLPANAALPPNEAA